MLSCFSFWKKKKQKKKNAEPRKIEAYSVFCYNFHLFSINHWLAFAFFPRCSTCLRLDNYLIRTACRSKCKRMLWNKESHAVRIIEWKIESIEEANKNNWNAKKGWGIGLIVVFPRKTLSSFGSSVATHFSVWASIIHNWNSFAQSIDTELN